MNMNAAPTRDWPVLLAGEAMCLGLLGKALFSEPDREWIDGLIKANVFGESPFGEEQPEVRHGIEILGAWTRQHETGLSDLHFSELEADHTRLFIGLDTLPSAPWESVYFNPERMVFQEQTLQVREWYARYGLQAERFNREPDDHIGLELSFVSHLASLALQALEAGDQPTFKSALQAQRDFLSQHLLRWGPAWARLVKQNAGTGFYRGLAHLAHGALLAAADHLDIDLPKEVSL
jgi:TorA maturation chaperone TorD